MTEKLHYRNTIDTSKPGFHHNNLGNFMYRYDLNNSKPDLGSFLSYSIEVVE